MKNTDNILFEIGNDKGHLGYVRVSNEAGELVVETAFPRGTPLQGWENEIETIEAIAKTVFSLGVPVRSNGEDARSFYCKSDFEFNGSRVTLCPVSYWGCNIRVHSGRGGAACLSISDEGSPEELFWYPVVDQDTNLSELIAGAPEFVKHISPVLKVLLNGFQNTLRDDRNVSSIISWLAIRMCEAISTARDLAEQGSMRFRIEYRRRNTRRAGPASDQMTEHVEVESVEDLIRLLPSFYNNLDRLIRWQNWRSDPVLDHIGHGFYCELES